MKIIETERLLLSEINESDAEFVLEILNEPGWIQNIGDRGVRTIEDARRYIVDKLAAGYERNGFGLYLVELKETGASAGMCGLVKRDSLADADIGFAFLERFQSKGYAFESAAAVMDYARNKLGLKRILAIVAPGNRASIKLLEKLGLGFERMIKMPGEDEEIKLFARHF
ncbi:MAG TPA: GNAT family N-acetyltransferase [Pyrinomonadaceae bacterium]|nr:GNAT family N-acetyltransferase [Pyrinomonadaceae bacterium]